MRVWFVTGVRKQRGHRLANSHRSSLARSLPCARNRSLSGYFHKRNRNPSGSAYDVCHWFWLLIGLVAPASRIRSLKLLWVVVKCRCRRCESNTTHRQKEHLRRSRNKGGTGLTGWSRSVVPVRAVLPARVRTSLHRSICSDGATCRSPILPLMHSIHHGSRWGNSHGCGLLSSRGVRPKKRLEVSQSVTCSTTVWRSFTCQVQACSAAFCRSQTCRAPLEHPCLGIEGLSLSRLPSDLGRRLNQTCDES